MKKTVRKLRQQLVTEQLKDPNFTFSLPKDFYVEGTRPGGLIIDRVILSIYVSQPGWGVRRPMEFMTELLVKFKEQCTTRNVQVRSQFEILERNSLMLDRRDIVSQIWYTCNYLGVKSLKLIQEAEVELVISGMGVFFQGQSALLPRVCETGCIPSIVQALTSQQTCISIAAVKVVHILAADPVSSLNK